MQSQKQNGVLTFNKGCEYPHNTSDPCVANHYPFWDYSTQRFEIPPVRVPKWLMKEIERYKLPFIHTIANQCNNPDGSAMNIERRNEVVSRCFFNNTSPGNCKVVEILRQNEHELTKNVEKAIYSHTVVIDFVINRTQQVIFLCYKEKEAPRVPDADVSV